MKITKLVLGIISLAFSLIVIFQSCAAGIGNTLSENGESSGSAGIFVALLMIAGGVVTIAARNSKGGAIASTAIYALGAIIGFCNAGSYKDLYIWSGLCVVIAIVCVLSIFLQKFPKKPTDTIAPEQKQ